MLNTFYALLGRMKYIDRWCLMRSSRPENLCEHTLETAYIAHALALLNRQRGGTLGRKRRCCMPCTMIVPRY